MKILCELSCPWTFAVQENYSLNLCALDSSIHGLETLSIILVGVTTMSKPWFAASAQITGMCCGRPVLFLISYLVFSTSLPRFDHYGPAEPVIPY
jgi:hypothetical protein